MKDGRGKTIKGYYENGVLNGHAFVKDKTKNNVYSYRGEIENGQFQGIGEEIVKDTMYFGCFSQGSKHGIGLIKTKRHNSYLGNWDSGRRHGFGMEHFENCDMYFGDFKMEARSGIGKYCHRNSGFFYLGEIEDGKRQGFGKLESLKMIYVGNWVKDEREGRGYQEFKDGRAYFGDWVKGRREGLGYEKSENVEYRGEWYNDKPHGRGILLLKNGETQFACFNQGSVSYLYSKDDNEFFDAILALDVDKFFGKSTSRISQFEEYLNRNTAFTQDIYYSMEFDIMKIEKKLTSDLKRLFRRLEHIVEDVKLSRIQFSKLCADLPESLLEPIKYAFNYILDSHRNTLDQSPSSNKYRNTG